MPFDVVIRNAIASGGVSIDEGKTYTGNSRFDIDEPVADSVTDQLHAVALDIDQAVAIWVMSTVDMTVEFNDSTTGVPTIALKANVPHVWTTDSYPVNLFTADLTAMYVTNASGSAGRIKFGYVVDPTV